MKWNEMKWDEMKRNEMKWNEMKWNEMKWNETKWNEMKWNEMKWNAYEMQWGSYQRFNSCLVLTSSLALTGTSFQQKTVMKQESKYWAFPWQWQQQNGFIPV